MSFPVKTVKLTLFRPGSVCNCFSVAEFKSNRLSDGIISLNDCTDLEHSSVGGFSFRD